MRAHGALWFLAACLLPFSGCIEQLEDWDADPDGADAHAAHADHEGHEGMPEDHGHEGSMQAHGPHSFRVPMGFDPEKAPDLAHEPPFLLEAGARPSESQAKDFADQYESIRIKGNEGLAKLRAEGYLTGNGTTENPYVLEKFYVNRDLTIESTDRALIVREGYVKGTLRLNYIGEALYVHHVYATDLRVNENIKRAGPNTGGLFHDNAFAVVGQIRHFVGEFRNNEVGPRPENMVIEALGDTGLFVVAPTIVFNLDGFHTADIHHNLFEGAVVAKLHGHNHGDCFTCPVHDHANETLDAERMAGHEHEYTDADEMDDVGFATHHSIRYVSLAFHDNEIRVDEGVALRYNDRNHAGDDRTANSETNEHLKDPHVHFQDITFERNRLVGGSFQVDVFNAEDDKHVIASLGAVRVLGNDIAVNRAPGALLLFGHGAPATGLRINDARGLELRVRDNAIRFVDARDAPLENQMLDLLRAKVELSGIELAGLGTSNLTIATNRVESGTYGVFAARLEASVHWILEGNDFRTEHAWRGRDVGEPPREDP